MEWFKSDFWFYWPLHNPYKTSEKGLEEAKIYSTVTDCFKTNSPNSKSGEFKILKQFNISFKLVVKSSSLTSLHHYNNKQQQLYVTIKHLKEVKGYGYRRISQILCEKGFTTVRSNKPILNNYVHSIYKRGKTREERINRGYESTIQDMMSSFIFGRFECNQN